MIRSTGVFLDTRNLTASFVTKYHKQLDQGLLHLRGLTDEGEPHDLPILEEWRSADAFLKRFKNAASGFLGGQKAILGKAWIESLPGGCGTPWLLEDDDYAQAYVRTRVALIATPGAFTYSGDMRELLGIGVVNIVEHRILHSDTNPSTFSRVHLVVDVKRPEAPDEEAD